MSDRVVAGAESRPAPSKGLFVRQSSGLVREVSVTNALFYNSAAFIGNGVGLYPTFYALAFLPVGTFFFFSSYAWAAIISGVAGIFLALIFASLGTVMPRSGGDYVYTSRFIPGVGPLLAWLESWTLVFASIAVIAFEIPVILRDLQISGRIIGIGTGIGFFERANDWFATTEGITAGWPGFIGSAAILALVFLIVIQPTRRLHKIVTALAAFGILTGILMLVVGVPLIDHGAFVRNLPKYTGATLAQIRSAADKNGITGSGVAFAPSVMSFFVLLVLFNYIGFQYSAYIAGEVRGKITRGIMISVLGALALGIFLNSIYIDVVSKRLDFKAQLGWGSMFWTGDAKLPLGQPNAVPLQAAISRPGAWILWLIVMLGGTILPFILIPVYINFISRISLAWSLDRQVPEWFGAVNERVRAPLNAILVALGISFVLTIFQSFALLPDSVAPGGRLNLIGTVWFSALTAMLAWIMPGVNAVVAPFTRPDLLRNAPWRKALPWLGAVWLIFSVTVYWFAGIKPIWDAITNTGTGLLSYLNTSGISFALFFFVIGVIIYAIQRARNAAAGVDLRMLYHEIPPD
jgi:basic amino acid/polyamine antiporter, APA family